MQKRLLLLLILYLVKQCLHHQLESCKVLKNGCLANYFQSRFFVFSKTGNYKITINVDGTTYNSLNFAIEENVLAKRTISAIVHYYNKQRANTSVELDGDKNMLLFGSTKKVDVRGGWCDTSGDVSKYFSHLAYANFVSPQQIPLVTWSLINTLETIPKQLMEWKIKDS